MRKLSFQLVLVFILILMPIQFSAMAQCNDGLESAVGAGTIMFGLVGVDDRMELAQSFLIDCDAQLTQVACRVLLEDAESGGIHSLMPGDIINCRVLDSDKNLIMAKDHVITEALGSHDLVFDFSDYEFRLVTGTYHYVISTNADKYCRMWWGESFVDGAAFYISNDTWEEQGGDWRSHLLWDWSSTFTATDDHNWNSLKACYR